MASNWLSTQQWILGMSSHSIVSYSYHLPNGRYEECSFLLCRGNDHLSALWQFLVGRLLVIGDVLYCRTCGEGFQTWTTDGHPLNGGCDTVHVGHAHDFISHDVTRAHTRDPWACYKSYGHGTYWYFEVHLYQFWSMQTSRYFREASWWGWQLHECQGLCCWRGLGWSRGPQRGDQQLYWYHLGDLAQSHLQPPGPGLFGDVPCSHHWLGWVQHLLPS